MQDVAVNSSIQSTWPIRVRNIQANNGADWFFLDRIVGVLKSHGFENIYVGPEENQQSDQRAPFVVFEYKVLSVGIKYINRNPEKSIEEQRLQRIGHVGLFVRIFEQPSGRLLRSEEIKGAKADWVERVHLSQIENPNISFTQGEIEGIGRNNKFWEPVLITGVTGIIVFLFYSLRSR
ncbi:MAG: hypothetical protein ACE5HO_02325 [bacterium]